MNDRPKMDESKSICFWCKHSQVLDCMRTQTGVAADAMGRPILNPISQQPMIETRNIYAYTVVCHARSGALPLNSETVVLQCTEFDEMAACPQLRAPAPGEEEKPKDSVQ